MKHLYTTLMAILLTGISFVHAQISVDATAGSTSATYSTLSLAFTAINSGTHQGAITVTVHQGTTETASCFLDSAGSVGGATYTSILIKPADTSTVVKEITTSVAGNVLLELKGADNITVDGRLMGAGTTRYLRFKHTATTNTASITLRLINGASNCSFKYTEFSNATRLLTGSVNISFSTSAATTGNTNDTLDHCFIDGGRSAFSAVGTVLTPMNNIILQSNTFFEFANVGIGFSGTKNFTIDSNFLYFATAGPTNPIGMNISLNVDGAVGTITRNRIQDLSTSATTTITGIAIAASVTAPVATPVANVYNNFVSLMQSSGTASSVTGMSLGGTTPVVSRMIHNTIRVGGTHTAGTTGTVVSYGCLLNNSSVTSNTVFRNNVMINNRTGGTTGLFHTAFRISAAAILTVLDIDYNIYWATGGAGNGPYAATWGNTLYGTQAGYRTAAAPSEQHSIHANVNFVSNTDLSLTGASINDYLSMGCPKSTFVNADIFNTTRLNPAYKGAHESTPFTNRIDAAVKEVYTLGKLPIPYAVPHAVRANIINQGIDTLFNQQVNLSVTGPNTYSNVQFIDTILPGAAKIVSFISSSAYINTGTGLVTVTVPLDSTVSNNSKTFNQIITNDVYAYAEPTLPAAGGVGFNGSSGEFVAKFPYTGANAINQVGINFNTGGQPYKIVIYDILNDTPGVLLWTSASLTSVTGINTIPVFPTVPISGTFFVGVKQTGTVNVAFGYQAEDPIRDKTFYYKNLTIGIPNWNDFAVTNSAFRFMVEPRLQVANDLGVESVIAPCLSVIQGSAPMNPKVKVLNYGINNQTSVIVSHQITGPVASSGIDTFSLGALTSGQSASLTLGNLFNPTVAGTYTMKVWTRIPLVVDGAHDNDTATYTFTVSNAIGYTNAGNQLVLNGTSQSASIDGEGSVNITGSMLSLESWVYFNSLAGDRHLFSKNQSDIIPQYNLYINTAGLVVFKLNTVNGVDSVVSASGVSLLAYSHIAATYNGSGDARIYVNGNLVGAKAIFGNIVGSNGTLYIGRGYAGGTTYFGGNLDEVRLWDTTRTETQIRNTMHTRLANSANIYLKGYWRMDSIINNVITDASGNCNAAMLENAPVLSVSPLPIGSPVVSSASVTASGVFNIPTSALSLNVFNQAGTSDIVVHRFNALPHGTLPSTTPGGVTNTNINNWVVYRYGTGTMDSAEVTFSITGITSTANPTDINLYSRAAGSNAGWTLISTASAVNPTLQTVTLRMVGLNFGSQITIGANNNPLPVKLIYFGAKNNNMNVDLTWATASETDNAGFHIERSVNGKEFEEVAFVKGHGNSSDQVNYTLRDPKAFAITGSQQLYYRLVQTDFSGKQEISNIVMVDADKTDEPVIALYPNPFTAEMNIHIDVSTTANAQIRIVDITGKNVLNLTPHLNKGVNTIETEGLAALSKGVYFIQVNVNGEISTHKLVKQ